MDPDAGKQPRPDPEPVNESVPEKPERLRIMARGYVAARLLARQKLGRGSPMPPRFHRRARKGRKGRR